MSLGLIETFATDAPGPKAIWLIAAVLGSALASNLLTHWLVPRLEARGVFDIPNQRSSHATATVRGAGLAPALTWAVSSLLLVVLLRPRADTAVFAVLALAVGLSVVGFWDDLRGLNPAVRLTGQVVLCSVAIVLGVRTESLTFPGLPVLHLGSLTFAICAIGLLMMVNFFNFMDGIDGLAIGQTVVAASVLMVSAVMVHAFSIAILAACLVGAAAGFVPFNWSPARCFMGDAGSYFCGGALGALLVLGQRSGIPVLLIGLASAAFLADAAITLVIRLAKGHRIWEAHHSHFYQRMVTAGWPHRRVAGLYVAVAAATGTASVLYLARAHVIP